MAVGMSRKFDLSKSHQHSTKVFKILWHLHKRLKKNCWFSLYATKYMYFVCTTISLLQKFDFDRMRNQTNKYWIKIPKELSFLFPFFRFIFFDFLVERCKYLHPLYIYDFERKLCKTHFTKKHHLFRENFFLFFWKFTFNNFF